MIDKIPLELFTWGSAVLIITLYLILDNLIW